MKLNLPFASTCLLLSLSVVARADLGDSYQFGIFPRYKPVVLRLEQVKTEDDYLLEVARAGDLNVIADVTSVAPKEFDSTVYSPVESGLPADQPTPVLTRALDAFTASNDLAQRRVDFRTYLFWKGTNPLELGRKLATYQPSPPFDIATREQQIGTVKQVLEQDIDEETLNSRLFRDLHSKDAEQSYFYQGSLRLQEPLRDYYRHTYSWNTLSLDFKRRPWLRELPPTVRRAVIQQVREAAYYASQGTRVKHYKLWFTDDFWSKARLWTTTSPQAPNSLVLWVGVPDTHDSIDQQVVAFLPRTDLHSEEPATPEILSEWRRASTEAVPIEANPIRPSIAVPGLSALVSLEAKHEKLNEVLQQVKTQSGVTLTLSPEVDGDKILLTARVREMPVSEWMRSVRRLFDGHWEKTAEGWSLSLNARPEIERMFLRLGQTNYSLDDLSNYAGGGGPVDWGYKVVEISGLEALNKPGGVPVSALQEPDLAALRVLLEKNFTQNLLEIYEGLTPVIEEYGSLGVNLMDFGRVGKDGKDVIEHQYFDVMVSTFVGGTRGIGVSSFTIHQRTPPAEQPTELAAMLPPLAQVNYAVTEQQLIDDVAHPAEEF